MEGDALKNHNAQHGVSKPNVIEKPTQSQVVSELFSRPMTVEEPKTRYEYPSKEDEWKFGQFYRNFPKGANKWKNSDWDTYLDYIYPENGNEDYEPAKPEDMEDEIKHAALEGFRKTLPLHSKTMYDDDDGYELEPYDIRWVDYYNRLVDLYLKRGGNSKKYQIDEAPRGFDYDRWPDNYLYVPY